MAGRAVSCRVVWKGGFRFWRGWKIGAKMCRCTAPIFGLSGFPFPMIYTKKEKPAP